MANNDPTITAMSTDMVTAPAPGEIYPQGPVPLVSSSQPSVNDSETAVEERGIGVEGEKVVWEGRYSMKNFVVRLAGFGIVSVGWLVLAGYTFSGAHQSLRLVALASGVALAFVWLLFVRRMVLGRFGHAYQLTNRRLFISTGVLKRRRDQIELLRLQDLYTKQNMLDRLLDIGTVAVVSTEPNLPLAYLAGVDRPKGVMDLVWHHARAERDLRSVKVDQL
jgi:membrane protein YdbS with pleckstrin-like domain